MCHLRGGHLPIYPQNSDICYPLIRTFTTPKNRTFARRTTATPNCFFFFSGSFFLQLMEDIKDEKEEVLDGVVIEHIKYKVYDEAIMEHIN